MRSAKSFIGAKIGYLYEYPSLIVFLMLIGTDNRNCPDPDFQGMNGGNAVFRQ
ncbi:MAG TPA: hypothetical protein VIG72_05715 [Pontibacter sp.]